VTSDGRLFAEDGLELLDERECRQLLEEQTIGRVVIVTGGVAAVFPVSYKVVGGDIVYFTGEGTKLRHAVEPTTVSFEVDDFDAVARSGWSVLVVGEATEASGTLARRAESLGVVPWAAGPRHHAVRIRPEMITGRRIR
jgi:nitroimidazol reductase NimA-like FMN-containing flavoprotein (pyridoxamine 5'-phosphate oxidase superfamily)